MDKIDAIKWLELGQEGEHIANTIEIDVSDWLTNWPDASLFIIALRPDENKPYVTNTEIEDNVLMWHVENYDTQITGVGHVEVRAVGLDGMIKKSKVIKTYVNQSITDDETSYDDRAIDFLNNALSAAATIYKNKLRVQGYDNGLVKLGGAQGENGGYLLDTTLKENGKAPDSASVGNAISHKVDRSELDNFINSPLAVMPVGYVYVSFDQTNPQTLFGGKWEQINGVMMLAAGNGHEAGSTGGSETVLLTASQIPTEEV